MTSLILSNMNSKSQRKDLQKKEIVPRVVQPGALLPSLHRDVTDVWTPLFPGTKVALQSKDRNLQTKLSDQGESPRCKKYRNLLEYKQGHKTDIGLEKKLWKIPNYSSNVLPSRRNRMSENTNMRISELYEKDFRTWYGRLVHENTVILSPLETSVRAKENVFDSTNLNEKRYILNDKSKTGQMARYASEELYLPDIYNQLFTCRECRSNYVTDMFRQKTFKRHNTLIPTLSREGTRHFKRVSEQQHCDVLGERYCRACIEKRNKRLSRDIEDKLAYVKDINKIHYK